MLTLVAITRVSALLEVEQPFPDKHVTAMRDMALQAHGKAADVGLRCPALSSD